MYTIITHNFSKYLIHLFVAISFGMLLIGCAAHLEKNPPVQKPKLDIRAGALDKFSVKIRSNSDALIAQEDIYRISDRIRLKIDKQRSKIFANSDVNRDYEINILVTNYRKGHRLSHLMPTGLNKLSIHAKVSITTLPLGNNLAEFDVTKVYTPEKLSDITSSVFELEDAFAEDVAELIFH